MKKIIILLFICLIFPLNVNGAYTVTLPSGNGNPTINGSYTNESGTTTNYRIGGNTKMVLHDQQGHSKDVQAYCVDPLRGTPTSVSYKKGTPTHTNAYKYVFDNTNGNDNLRIAALKALALELGDARSCIGYNSSDCEIIQNGYKSVMKQDSNAVIDGANIKELRNIVNQAKEIASNVASSGISLEKLTEDNNGTATFMIQNYSGEVECTGKNATCTCTGTTCTVKADSGVCQSGKEYGAVVTISSENGNSGSCTPSFYEPSDSENSSLQRLVACDPGSATEPLEIYFRCTKNECLPYSNELESKKDGFEMCMPDGTTIIQIYEVSENMYDNIPPDSDAVKRCVLDGEDFVGNDISASKIILGDNIPKFRGENMCDIYCTEDYELNLPGPDANKSAAEVLINAGTFFTINDGFDGSGNPTMYDKTRVSCFGKSNYSVLEGLINNAREKTVDSFNEVQRKKVAESGEIQTTTCQDGCRTYDENGVCTDYYYSPCTRIYYKDNGKYPIYQLETSGEIRENGTAHLTNTGYEFTPNNHASQLQSTKDRYQNAENNLETSVKNYTDEKEKLIEYWDDKCFNWSLGELNRQVYGNDKNVSIEFYYHDQGNVKIKRIYSESNSEMNGIQTENPVNQNLQISYCNINGCENDTNPRKTQDADYNYWIECYENHYQFDNFWCNKYDGMLELIDEGGSCDNGTIIKGFPVNMDTPQGTYWYKYFFSGIGHYFNDENGHKVGDTGRLEDVASGRYSINDNTFTNFCTYDVNNCGNCNVECEPPRGKYDGYFCELDFIDCKRDCQVKCVGGGCILDINAGFLATYRTISLNKPIAVTMIPSIPSPNNMLLALNLISPFGPSTSNGEVSSTREFNGSNWNTEKGKKTMDEIVKQGEEIYDSDPEFEINLTPSVIQDIKEYNQTTTYTDFDNGEYGSLNSNEYAIYHSSFMKKFFNVQESNSTSYDGNYKNTPFTGPAWK